ncbi:BolA family protein [Caulobacter sp. S45]|jgi:BolA protein|uniref:BolA family protein n=1 Tax=Caulobacter sp. S45 TaxID=1641861 RepID=UPI00352B3579
MRLNFSRSSIDGIIMTTMAQEITTKLTAAFAPERLEVVDDSDKHAGHSGARAGGESHFTVKITTSAFTGVGRLQRQRQVYAVLAAELAGPVHALSVQAFAPGEGG